MQELTKDTFGGFINSPTPVLVDFWAGWCMPCKILSPVLQELANEMGSEITFGKINIDDFVEVAQQYDIVSIPTLILFKDGKPIDQLVGVRPKHEIEKALRKHL